MAEPVSVQADSLAPDARFDIGSELFPRISLDTSVAIPMSDGVVLCADLYLPADRAGRTVAGSWPVVVNFTPYNRLANRYVGPLADVLRRAGARVSPSDRRRFRGRDMLHTPAGGAIDVWATNRALVSRGYGVLVVDVRGTGSSTGVWDFFSPREQLDYAETLDWLRAQPWCNGRLGMTGISYGAIAALIAAGQQPQGLDAIYAIVAGEDAIRELGFTGGVPTIAMAAWIALVNAGKWWPSPRGLIANRILGKYLWDRFRRPVSCLLRMAYIAMKDGHPDGFLNDEWAQRIPKLEHVTAATWIHGAWHDVYNRSNFRMYDRIAVPAGAKQVLVDDGYHMSPGCGFGEQGSPAPLDELHCAWFDRWLKGADNGIDRYGPVTVRRQGGGWVSRPVFPDPAATVRRLYLGAEPSGSAAHAGADLSLRDTVPGRAFRVQLPAEKSGGASNNTAIMGLGLAASIGADDRRAEVAALTFTTDPLDTELVISGPLNLHLRAIADGTEAFWSVTVSDIEPTGESAVLTRGALLSSLRATDKEQSTYVDGELLFPMHTLRAESFEPLVPGEPFEIDIDINPTEAVLRAGHRLRVSVSATSFPRHYLPPRIKRNIKGQSVVLDAEHPSYLTFLSARS